MEESLIIDDLQYLISKSEAANYIEARYQLRIINEVSFSNGELDRIRTILSSGCGIRVLVDGCWGFSRYY